MTKKGEPTAVLLFLCPIVTNYRTFVDDFMKIIQFIEEYNYYITDIMN